MDLSPTLIHSNKELEALCRRLKHHDHVAVDTEFMRETTYFARLCLIQVASAEEAAAIDPLADDLDLSPLFELMRMPSVIKVFHAGRQDLEIFLNLMGDLPTPIYDTQIAAMVCGFGDQVGYDRLVKGMLGKTIDKASRFTDWALRPLSEKQIRYALDDVIFLEEIFPLMVNHIRKAKREFWLTEEMDATTDPLLYRTDPEKAWKRIKNKGIKPAVLNRLKYLAAWRETEAQERNIPKTRLIKDDTLMALALANPSSAAAINRIRGFPGGAGGKLVQPVLTTLGKAASAPKETWPVIEPMTKAKPPQAVVDLLRVLLKHISDDAEVAPRLIASASDLEMIALGKSDGIKAMTGWRYEIFGKHAEAVRSGRLALSSNGSRINMHDVEKG
ncbi:ribonuclease D [Alphaproteobacteria bacterium LSUCC0684]